MNFRTGYFASLKNEDVPLIGTVAVPAPRVLGTSVQTAGLRVVLCCSFSVGSAVHVITRLLPETTAVKRGAVDTTA
jgi:hypothetical protein